MKMLLGVILWCFSTSIHALDFDGMQKEICSNAAMDYDLLISYKNIVSAQEIADTYTLNFTTKGADRETQAVWRRMHGNNENMETAIQNHFQRYHKRKTEEEKNILLNKVKGELAKISKIHMLIKEYESVQVNKDVVIWQWKDMYSKYDWKGKKPLGYYLHLIEQISDNYSQSGLSEYESALRAAVETQAAKDRDDGAVRSIIKDKNHMCFKDELMRYDNKVRNYVVAVKYPVSKEELKGTGDRFKNGVFPIWFYTHYDFGPQDYRYSRLYAIVQAVDNRSN